MLCSKPRISTAIALPPLKNKAMLSVPDIPHQLETDTMPKTKVNNQSTSSDNPSYYLLSEDDEKEQERLGILQKARRGRQKKFKEGKRAHKVKSDKQYASLMRLYLRSDDWSSKFMCKIAIRL